MDDEKKDFSQNEEVVEEADIAGSVDIESVKKALQEERERAERYLANWQRAEADFINFKKRNEQERVEQTNFANSTLITSLLPTLDDLERALENASDEIADATWIEGIRLIYRKLQSTLEAQGLSAIEATGQDFDPNIHDAVMVVDGEEGKVVEELQKGYKFRDRVIRPAMVKVGRKQDDSETDREK